MRLIMKLFNRQLAILMAIILLSGCSTGTYFLKANRTWLTTSFGNQIMIFGGVNHNIYLGNIMSESNPDSIYNKKGKFGNPMSELSINNHLGKYGSATSPLSVCNPYATNPPILKDKYDFVLGELTLNPYAESPAPPGYLQLLADVCKISN